MGIVVTVATLVVGIRAFNGIEYKIYAELIISLIVIVIALVIVLLIMIMFKRITLSFLNKIDDSFLEVFQREDMLNGFLAEKTFYINSLTIPLFAISRFIILLHGHRFDLSAAYEKASELLNLSNSKRRYLKDRADEEYARIEVTLRIYEKVEAFLQSESTFFGDAEYLVCYLRFQISITMYTSNIIIASL